VDHRFRLYRDARVLELPDLAALSTGMTDKETGVSNSGVPKIVVCLIAWLLAGLVISLSPCLGTVARADFDAVIDSPMYRNPELSFPREIVKFPEKAKELWLRALERPDAEMKCRAAQAIAEAHHRGVKGMETAIPALIVECDKENQPLAVRLAVARALVELDARESATNLFRLAQSGDGDLRDTIEPALARWDHRPARQVWLNRLREPTTPHRNLVLAIRGLAAVGGKGANDRLLEMVLDKRVRGPIRVEAARGLAKLRTEGLEKDAERLSADASPRAIVSRVAAASLLCHHRSPESIRLLQKLALDTEPSVATVAIAHLLEIDPDLLVPDIEKLLVTPEADDRGGVRSLAVDVLRRRPTEKHSRLLSERLDDAHIDVRRKARRYLLELAGDMKWRQQVIADAITMLKKQSWRGQEQATILLTQLDQKQVAGRLVELLRSSRGEVKVTAAWGLRKLDVPETLPAVVSFIEEDTKPRPAEKTRATPIGPRVHTISQLYQFVGQRKYRPALQLMRRFVPKFALGFVGECRAAAIWALGMILEGKSDPALEAELEVRLNDTGGYPPEDFRVRWMCAVTLARMKAKETLPSLRKHCSEFKPNSDAVNNACGWAIEQLTGEKMPPPVNPVRYLINWFLVPDKRD
jgi:HEAT repeat protein